MYLRESADDVMIQKEHYSIYIVKKRFRFGLLHPSGKPAAPVHPVSGIRWSNAARTVLYDAVEAELAEAGDGPEQSAGAPAAQAGAAAGRPSGAPAAEAGHADAARQAAAAPAEAERPAEQLAASASAPGAASPTAPAAASQSLPAQAEQVAFRVRNAEGRYARVTLHLHDRHVRISVQPEVTGAYTIEVRTAPMRPVYGLGDFGSHVNEVLTEDAPASGKLDIPARDTADLFGLVRHDLANQGTNMRFISTFTVYPAHGFAQVLFEEGSKRVAFTKEENKLGANRVESLDKVYYFIGDMRTIYREYRQVRYREGYPDKKPKYLMFRVGWEAYGSLGWNSYQSAVEEALTEYRQRGYELAWGVVGSGFWKGDRKLRTQGTTTSFGIWDTEEEPGRTDGLPNPRYPDPDGLKKFFREAGIKLMIGIRHHFKAPAQDGGYHDETNNGTFMEEGLARGYFLKDRDGHLVRITNAEFPKGTLYVLDSRNREALDWFVGLCETWGAEGFKEDAMVYTKHGADGNWNPINEAFMDRGYLTIVRNSAYSVPGDVIRINDTYYGTGEGYHFDQDRVPINLLNFAASGASNLYPDITGGTPKTDPRMTSYQRYFVRNAMFNAVCPAMSMGRKPWEMNNPEFEAAVKKAADWHNRYAPYLYSSVLDAYESGYPEAMTPLHIAYPNDPATYGLINRHTRQYQWMLGPSMMACPLGGNDFDTAESRDVYLPEGEWMDYETGETFTGPVTLKNYPQPVGKIPVFIGGAGITVTTGPDGHGCFAEVYAVAPAGTVYRFTHPDGESRSVIRVLGGSGVRAAVGPGNTAGAGDAGRSGRRDMRKWTVTDPATGAETPFTAEAHKLAFQLLPGREYTVSPR